MKKIYTILVATTMLFGCYEPNSNSHQFSWATVDKQALENNIHARTTTLNPYPSDIGMEKDKIYDEKRKLSSQLSELKRTARGKCISPQKESKKEEGQSNISGYKGPAPIVPSRINSMRQHKSFKSCYDNIKSDPLIMELEQRKGELENIKKMQREHDKQIRGLSNKYAKQLIERFSKSKYEIIVSGKDGVVLYNSTGLTLDITDALIAEIDDMSLVLKKESTNRTNQ